MKIFNYILWITGLLIWSSCFALGFNFGEVDSLLMSVILFIAVFGIMGVAVFLLNKWANPEGGVNRSSAQIKERACLAAYVVMVCLTAWHFAHFVTVQTDVNSKVRPLALERIDQIQVAFGDEETTGSYLYYVDDMASTYRNQLIGQGMDNSTANSNVAQFCDAMNGFGEFQKLKDGQEGVIKSAYSSIANWIPWSVTESLQELDKNSKEWKEKLEAMSRGHEWAIKCNQFYECNIGTERLSDKVKDASKSDFGLLSILIIVLLQIMILFPYLRGKDWSSNGPQVHTGGPGGMGILPNMKSDESSEKKNTEEV